MHSSDPEESNQTGQMIPAKRKATLADLLETARQADDELIGSEIDLEDLGGDLQTKIDNIVEYLYRNEALAKGLKERADEFARKAKAIENHNERLKEYVAYHMELDAKLRFGHEPMPEKAPKFKLGGKAYEFVLNFSDVVEPKREPNQYDYITPSIGKNFIKRAYTWNKNALKNAIQNGNEEISEIAVIRKKPWIKINPKI